MPETTFSANTQIKSAEVNDNFNGAFSGDYDDDANSLRLFRDESLPDHVVSGGVITDPGATLTQTTTSLVAIIDGYRVTIAATPKTYTASKDTYVDVLRSGSGASYVYTEVNNGVASPALAANSIRIAKVVTNGTEITSVQQYGADSLNNRIYPVSALGVWQTWFPTITTASGSFTSVSATGKYIIWGKTLHFTEIITITTNGTATNTLTTVPYPPLVTTSGTSIAWGRESAVSGSMVQMDLNSSTTGIIRTYDNGNPNANGAVIYIRGFYEVS